MDNQPPIQHLVEASAVAEHLSVPVTWVREQTRRNALPHFKLGHYRRYCLSQIDHWLISQSLTVLTPAHPSQQAGAKRAPGGIRS